jgi:hypothetical protein
MIFAPDGLAAVTLRFYGTYYTIDKQPNYNCVIGSPHFACHIRLVRSPGVLLAIRASQLGHRGVGLEPEL